MTSPPGDATGRPGATPAVIRAARAQDAAAITAVHLASRSAAMPWLPVLHTEEETAVWVREVVVPTSRVWVAEEPVAGDGGVGGGKEGPPDVTYRWSPRAGAPPPPSGGDRQDQPS